MSLTQIKIKQHNAKVPPGRTEDQRELFTALSSNYQGFAGANVHTAFNGFNLALDNKLRELTSKRIGHDKKTAAVLPDVLVEALWNHPDLSPDTPKGLQYRFAFSLSFLGNFRPGTDLYDLEMH